MNLSTTFPSFSSRPSRRLGLLPVFALGACALAAASGCGQDKMFSINGQTVTKDEYIRALERQPVAAPGGSTNGVRAVVDQLVGNQIVLSEAAKANVLPSDDQVESYFKTQQQLFQATNPGKDYAKAMADEGTTPEEVKANMKVQLAESALYAKRLNIDAGQIQQEYNRAQGRFGLPARVQLRMVLTQPGSPEFQAASKALADKKTANFNEVAGRINPPQLKATQGLLPQTIPMPGGMAADFASKVNQTADGAYFGPTPFKAAPNAPTLQAWVKVEKKLPAYTIPPDAAAPLVRSQLVQSKLADPASSSVRQDLIKKKLDASFDAQGKYANVWAALKKSATDAGLGATTPGASVAGAGGGGAAGAMVPTGK